MHRLKWADLCKSKWYGGMGFRDLVAFNKALLAKQVWRIIFDPNSLLVRVLKGCYFKSLDVMVASLGSNPSYVWRSLSCGRDLLLKGLCWRVGDVNSISVYSEPWIPNLHTYKCCFNSQLYGNLKVANLITDGGVWNEELVRSIFLPYEAEAILDILLNRRSFKDIRIWKRTENRKYSVKSGYHMEINSWAAPPFQSCHPIQNWWKLIWSLISLPKFVFSCGKLPEI